MAKPKKFISRKIGSGIKGLSMSKKSLLKRYKVLNPEIVDQIYKQNKSVITVASHYANWEWDV